MKIAALLRPLLRDLAGILGCGMIVRGAWLANEPAGWLVGGAMLVAAALVTARPKKAA
jgi:hypothetical protein